MSKAPEDPFVSEIRRQADRARDSSRTNFWRGLASLGGVGWMVSLPAVVGALVGRWLDREFASGVFWTLSLLVGGVLLGSHRLAPRRPGVKRVNLVVAIAVGFGLGLACFGGLWLTVRQLAHMPRRTAWLTLGQTGRLVLCALAFYALSRQGLGPILAALAGFWIARWHLLHRWGVVRHGR